MYKKTLIVGYGSIGRRHEALLTKMSSRCYVVSKQKGGKQFFTNIEDALKEHTYDLIVICNETHLHRETLEKVRNATTSTTLVEKPLFHDTRKSEDYYDNVYVGYNLRFHDHITAIKNKIKSQTIYSVEVNACKYLPSWRPNTDYRKSYSADPRRGGGVLLDLSHELDYLRYLFGELTCKMSNISKISSLDIKSEDKVIAILESPTCKNILVNLGYINHIGQRNITVNLKNDTIYADLVSNKIQTLSECDNTNRNLMAETYYNMHQHILSKNSEAILCTYLQALETNKLINQMKEMSIA